MTSSFSAADAAARIPSLVDAGSVEPLAGVPSRSGLIAASARVQGRPVVVAALDRAVSGGSIGVEEAGALAQACETARERNAPLVLCLESAGARLSQGVAALAAFRLLYRSALAAATAGTPLIALAPGACFGGAAMLASLCARRFYGPRTLTAMSGPGIVAALGGDAPDRSKDDAVRALMAGSARAALDSDARVLDDAPASWAAALRSALAAGSCSAPAFEAQHAALRRRLADAGVVLPSVIARPSPRLGERLTAFGGPGFESVLGDGVVRGVRKIGTHETSMVGVVHGLRVGAAAAWMLAESIYTAARQCPERPIVLLLDSAGHAPTCADEALILADYVAHVARAVAWAQTRAVPVTVAILGEASGGLYVACTAAASRVVMLPGADVQVLPQAAVRVVLGTEARDETPRDTDASAGVADLRLADDGALAGALAA